MTDTLPFVFATDVIGLVALALAVDLAALVMLVDWMRRRRTTRRKGELRNGP
jgi:hypothetical protein